MLSKKWYVLFIPAAVLISGILTNDFHQHAFYFSAGLANWEKDYSYGILYYADSFWIYALFIAGVCVIFWRSKIPRSRKRIGLPFIWFPIAISYVIYYATGPYFFPMPP